MFEKTLNYCHGRFDENLSTMQKKLIHLRHYAVLLIAAVITNCAAQGQHTHRYNLAKMLKNNMLDTSFAVGTKAIQSMQQKNAITTTKVVWLKGVSFNKGTIDVDLRGKDVFLNSFLGIAFHGIDSLTYDAVYFRPFNFKHLDTLRRKWSVQYFRLPEFDYDKLRKEHPLTYENAVSPVPDPSNWFHATIVVDGAWVTVYVDNSPAPCLKAPLLTNRKGSLIGLWDAGLSGDFANLVIRGSQ